MMSSNNIYFATCPKGLETLLFNELQALGLHDVRETVAGVYFSGRLVEAYRVCLWSRLANRILLPLSKAVIHSDNDLYTATNTIEWSQYFSSDKQFVVDFIGTNDVINNSQYGALKVKDAIVDHFRSIGQPRPDVNKQSPDVRINVRLDRKNNVFIALDFSSGSLHNRGYRQQQGAAPLKENLAAALLIRAKWLNNSELNALVDPMCGSGTLVIEAAMMSCDVAPGLLRKEYGFEYLEHFDEAAWQSLVSEAIERKKVGIASLVASEPNPIFLGFDQDPRMVRSAKINTEIAGLSQVISFQRQSVDGIYEPVTIPNGLVITNPPYGERLGELEALQSTYKQLGCLMLEHFNGWQAAVFTAHKELGFALGFRVKKKYALFNGTIPTELLCFTIENASRFKQREPSDTSHAMPPSADALSTGATMVYNRMKKNAKQLKRWLKNNELDCYRLYNADLPEYAAVIDIYNTKAHVQEYLAPKSVDETAAKRRFSELIQAVQCFTGFSRQDIITKQRKPQKGSSQYQKNDEQNLEYFTVKEYQARFNINLTRYLDTGLFLDSRGIRRTLANSANGKRFLNLFCYTATASVQAILAGAKSSVSVDLSATYLRWAQQNFDTNHIRSKAHTLVQADCLSWLAHCREGFDLILLDPPSFSNSKRMDNTFDVQRDHAELVHRCLQLLSKNGKLLFCNNLKGFSLDDSIHTSYQVQSLNDTLDPDCQRNTPHKAWYISNL